jgi:DNA processing protein
MGPGSRHEDAEDDLYTEEQVHWLAFSLLPGIGPRRMLQLHEAFGSLSSAWRATASELARADLDEGTRSRLIEARGKLDIKAEVAKVGKAGARLLTLVDEAYPALLKSLPDPPPVLYILGRLSPQDERALAVVGTRKATKYGKDFTYDLSNQLAGEGVTIVSGLAQGIDAAAHTGALDGYGRTIAIIGCGIDIIYPREHHELARRIRDNGAIISEFPIGTPPDGRNFPRRNRVISGISLAVLVAEAPENSGALITANMAAEQGRDVFAVPHNVYNPMGRGANRLIQDGAKLVMETADILNELNITHNVVSTRATAERIVPANDLESALLNCLSVDPLHIDEIVRMTSLPVSTVSSTLTILELKGLAQMVGPMQYSLTYA